MTGEELRNFCKFLYSLIQSKDEEISRLTANIKELTDQTRAYRYKEKAGNCRDLVGRCQKEEPSVGSRTGEGCQGA